MCRLFPTRGAEYGRLEHEPRRRPQPAIRRGPRGSSPPGHPRRNAGFVWPRCNRGSCRWWRPRAFLRRAHSRTGKQPRSPPTRLRDRTRNCAPRCKRLPSGHSGNEIDFIRGPSFRVAPHPARFLNPFRLFFQPRNGSASRIDSQPSDRYAVRTDFERIAPT